MQYPRINKAGRYLTQIMKVNDYTILFTPTSVYVQYLIKERCKLSSWDMVVDLFDENLHQLLSEYLDISSKEDYWELTRMIMFSRTHL
jgi:hypothetical protein